MKSVTSMGVPVLLLAAVAQFGNAAAFSDFVPEGQLDRSRHTPMIRRGSRVKRRIPYSREEKDRPDKGNPDCNEYEWNYLGSETILPCREFDIEEDDSEGLLSGTDDDTEDDDEDDNNDFTGDIGEDTSAPETVVTVDPTGSPSLNVVNDVVVSLYIGLRPREPSIGHSLIWVTTQFLNTTTAAQNFVFHLPQRETDDRLNDRRKLERDNGNGYRMVYDYTTSKVVREDDVRWWWQYNLTYHCLWSDSGAAILDASILDSIDQSISATLFSGIDDGSFQRWIIEETLDDSIQVKHSLEDGNSGRSPASPFDPATAPTTAPAFAEAGFSREHGSFATPLDQKDWDWRRYLGLGLFIGTVSVTLLLTQVAAYRQRLLTRKELWGNLGTEKGVDELLKLGWKVRNDNMEVYDKAGVGYRDDDSMLIGGFEQKEVVGAEITVTHPSSETTPDMTQTS
jgi:hypothetical protein